MEPTNPIIEMGKGILKSLEIIEPTAMTKEETALLIKRQIDLTKSLMELENSKQLLIKKYTEHQNQILKLDAEIATSEAFIYSKGLRKEYQSFKDKKLKIFNRNQKKAKLFN